MGQVNGAAALAQIIQTWQCGPAFHVPGEGILELLDALQTQSVPQIACRHEAGAAVAAQAAGLVNGRPGLCLVGRAPGALNTALALHTARTDAAPMILVIGQPLRAIAGREPYLDTADFAQAFGPSAKWVGSCERADQLVERFSRAWTIAMSGQRGPVVLVIQEDVWAEEIPAATLPDSPPDVARSAVQQSDVARIMAALGAAKRPLIIAGGTGWTADDAGALGQFATTTGIPVATSYRRRDLMPAAHPLFVGELGIGADPTLVRRVADSDCLLVLGMRLGEINTFGAQVFEGYQLLEAPVPKQRVYHMHPDPNELNAVYRTEAAILAHPAEALAQLQAAPPPHPDCAVWAQGLRAARTQFTTGHACPGPLDLREVFKALRSALPQDAMITVGAGAYAHWPQRYFPHTVFGTQLGPKSGAMGYAVPAAIGVQATQPARRVVAVTGDGCFMMQGEELATIAHYDLPVVTLVINNSLYGAIAASQSRMFGRRNGVALAAIDFTALAKAMGVAAYKVTTTADFGPALKAALSHCGPTLIELITTEEALKP